MKTPKAKIKVDSNPIIQKNQTYKRAEIIADLKEKGAISSGTAVHCGYGLALRMAKEGILGTIAGKFYIK